MKNKQQFSEFMAAIGEIFDKEISVTLRKIYWETLKPYPDDQCKRAFELALTTLKFFPKPSELLELVNGKPGELATLAWLRVDQAVKRVGPYESVDFADDRAINSTIEAMGGWPGLCNIDQKEWKWKQKEFENLYSVMAQRKNGDHPKSLPGVVEIENTGRGFLIPDVRQLTNAVSPLMLQ